MKTCQGKTHCWILGEVTCHKFGKPVKKVQDILTQDGLKYHIFYAYFANERSEFNKNNMFYEIRSYEGRLVSKETTNPSRYEDNYLENFKAITIVSCQYFSTNILSF